MLRIQVTKKQKWVLGEKAGGGNAERERDDAVT